MDLRQAFKILEVPEDATIADVKEAYRDLAKVWHPDRYTQNERLQRRAVEKMKELNAAYDCIRSYFDDINAAESTDGESRSTTSIETIVVCPECGTKNKFCGFIDKSRVKCGRCGAHIYREGQKTEDESYVLCGDGACIGRILDSTGRCNKCGKTFAEGTAAERERTERREQQQHRDELRLRRRRSVVYSLVAVGVIIGFLILFKTSPSSPPAVSKASPSQSRAALKVPIELEPVNPNQLKTGASPLKGGLRSGYSEITVENGTDTDAVVRVVRVRGSGYQNIRNFYVRANDQFVANKIPSGEYRLKVAFGNDWNSETRRFNFRKSFSETQLFTVEETIWKENREDGEVLRTRASKISITLHKVPHGNFQSHSIDEDSFWQ